MLYVTGGSDVDIYTWPELRTAGVLSGFQQTTGACVDSSGNVWIVDAFAFKLYEYAHGGTTPIATLDDPTAFPDSCSVSKRDGNLAVGNVYDGNEGSLTVYKHASGAGTVYYDTAVDVVGPVVYAPNGNIFLIGRTGLTYYVQKLVRKQFKTVSIKSPIITPSMGLQYQKSELTIGEQSKTASTATIFRIDEHGKVTGRTTLQQTTQGLQYEIRDGKVICACYGNESVQVYEYPEGGAPIKAVTRFKGLAPMGVVVSPAVSPEARATR
ncbi:MAG TPA: hypothetical protein VGK84_06500 [Candidatus Tumulicola sp.]